MMMSKKLACGSRRRRSPTQAVASGAGAVLLALLAGCASAPDAQPDAEAALSTAAAAKPSVDSTAQGVTAAATTAAQREATRAAIIAAVAVATVPDGDGGGIAAAVMAPPLFATVQATSVAEADAAAIAGALAEQADAASLAAGGPSIRFRKKGAGTDDDAASTRLGGAEVDRGTASWYGLQFHGRRTANGERYDMYELTAAHKTLPFNTIVTVRSLQTGRVVRVRINDRGPFVKGRVIDLSKAAAEQLGMSAMGVKPVSLTVSEWPDGVAEGAEVPRRSGKTKARRSRGEQRGD